MTHIEPSTSREQASSTPKALIVLLIVAALLRGAFMGVSFQDPPNRQMLLDSYSYTLLADQLRAGHGFTVVMSEPGKPPVRIPDLCRTPGFPGLLAGLGWLTGHANAAMIVLQSVLGVVLAWAMFVLCRRRFGNVAAWAAASWVAFDLQGIGLSNFIMTEVMFGYGLFASVVVIACSMERGSLKWGITGGLLLGFTTLIRPTTVYLPIPLALIIIGWGLYRRRRAWIGPAIAIAITASLITGAWVVRNGVRSGEYTFSSIGRFNLLAYHGGFALAHATGMPFGQARDQLCEQLGFSKTYLRHMPLSKEDNRRLVQLFLQVVKEHPYSFLREYSLRTVNVLFGPDKYVLWASGFGSPDFGVLSGENRHSASPPRASYALLLMELAQLTGLYVLTLICLWQIVRTRTVTPLVGICLIVALYTLFLSSGAPGDPRMRWPAIPLLVVAAASPLARWRTPAPSPMFATQS